MNAHNKKLLYISLTIILVVFGIFLLWNPQKQADQNSTPISGLTYYRCMRVDSNQTVFRRNRCGDDTCWITFYNSSGQVLEDTPEIGPGTIREYNIKTQTKDCAQISESNFNKSIRK